MNKSTNEQTETCQFFKGMRGDMVCDDPVVDGEDVCAKHLEPYQRVIADD